MTYMLNSIDEAIDGKFLVTKAIKNQTEVGTVIHIMDAEEASGSIIVSYRVTDNGQGYSYRDYTITFNSVKQFCEWAIPDSFIVRHYNSFTQKDILHYIRVRNRTFASFCLPIMLVLMVIIWVASIMLLDTPISIIVGAALSVIAIIFVFFFYKTQKTKVKLNLYGKISHELGVALD